MSDAALRSGLVRLAYENPDLRGELLPLLTGKQAGVLKAASGKPVSWAIPKGSRTNKGVNLKISVRSEAVFTKEQRPTPEGVADALQRVGKEQEAQVLQFVGTIVKASQKFKVDGENPWGFTFVSHGPNSEVYPVRVEFNEHGLYITGTYAFHLIAKRGTDLVETVEENLAKFNKTVMQFESLFF